MQIVPTTIDKHPHPTTLLFFHPTMDSRFVFIFRVDTYRRILQADCPRGVWPWFKVDGRLLFAEEELGTLVTCDTIGAMSVRI